MYLLDTNIVSYWMRGDKNIINEIKIHKPSELSICTITLAEIYYGSEKSPVEKKERHNKIERIQTNRKIRCRGLGKDWIACSDNLKGIQRFNSAIWASGYFTTSSAFLSDPELS